MYSIKYRARAFSEVIGQDQVTHLMTEYTQSGEWPTAIFLCGPTGTGKTTIAYLIAMTINCLSLNKNGNPCLTCPSCLSIINETFTRDTRRLKSDATGGKGDIQDFLEEIGTLPMFDRKKVYIIEESDQLSSSAKNFLHTTLENPRRHFHVILLSMYKAGIPQSVKDRCQPFNFNRLKIVDLMIILQNILKKSGLWEDSSVPKEFKLEGLKKIATCSQGSGREAIQNLDKCVAGKYFTFKEIEENIELIAPEAQVEQLLIYMLRGKRDDFYNVISQNFGVMEFIRFGYPRIARAILYKYTEEVDYESRIGLYKTMLEDEPNFKRLCDFFKKISRQAVNYLRFGDFVLYAEEYFDNWAISSRKPRKESAE